MAIPDTYLEKWNLVPDGPAIVRRTSRLVPVLFQGRPAMLKLSLDPGDRQSGDLLEWWNGQGAVCVLDREDCAILLERAEGNRSLAGLAYAGKDDEACRILCQVAASLHAARPEPAPNLAPLRAWFADLDRAASRHGGIFRICAATAQALLSRPMEACILHGDLHHGNILPFSGGRWLTIDPKGVAGERAFDFANLFTNPDLACPSRPFATDPARLARRLKVVTEAADLDRERLLRWIMAWAGLSAAWACEDGDRAGADIALAVARLALAEGGGRGDRPGRRRRRPGA